MYKIRGNCFLNGPRVNVSNFDMLGISRVPCVRAATCDEAWKEEERKLRGF